MLSHRSFYITLHFTFINYYSRNQSYELHMLEHVAATQCSPQLLECRLLKFAGLVSSLSNTAITEHFIKSSLKVHFTNPNCRNSSALHSSTSHGKLLAPHCSQWTESLSRATSFNLARDLKGVVPPNLLLVHSLLQTFYNSLESMIHALTRTYSE